MKKLTKLFTFAVAFVTAFTIIGTSVTLAATRTYGVDWAKYQNNYGKFGYARDKFVISQIGGITNGSIYTQSTYSTQVSSAIAAGKYAHTYIWYQVGNSTYNGQRALNYFLPRVKTPKGSIVALDYESGASSSKQGNTNAILAGMKQIKAAGYTPMLYSYKPYLNSHVYTSQVTKAFPNSLWVAAYANYRVTSTPNYNYFPSMNGVAIWQFTSMYRAGGLDGNVDLTGITKSGYDGKKTSSSGKVTVKPGNHTSATSAGQTANKTSKANITKGMTVKVNLSATKWATGQNIINSVKGNTYTVAQVSGNRVLLNGVMSWINKSDIEILATKSKVPTITLAVNTNLRSGPSTNYKVLRVLKSGTSWKYFAKKFNGYTWFNLGGNQWVAQVKKSSSSTASHTYYTVKSGDSFWSVSSKYGITMSSLASKNGLTIKSVIHPGQKLLIK